MISKTKVFGEPRRGGMFIATVGARGSSSVRSAMFLALLRSSESVTARASINISSLTGLFAGDARIRVAIVALSLLLAVPLSGFAQIVKLAGAQESKQRDSSATQTQAAPRVGVDESRPLALTLFDAVKMALEQNREIEVERLNVRQAEYDLFSAKGANDVYLGALSFYEHRNVPVGSVLAGGPNGSLTTKSLHYDFSAQQLMPTKIGR